MLFQKSHQRTRAKVLLLGDETRVMLPIIRSLGRKGIEVHVGWCPPHEAALKSRYINQVYDLLHYAPDEIVWRDELCELIHLERFDVVIPATESAVFAVQQHRSVFEDTGRVFLLNAQSYKTPFNKDKTQQLARSIGIPVPISQLVSCREDLDRIVPEASFPLIVKPCCSVNQQDSRVKNFVRHAESVTVLRELTMSGLGRGERFQIQEFINGLGVGVELLAHGGEILVAFQHQRLHETSGYGSTYRKSVPLDPDLLSAAKKITKALDYTGVLMVEFRVDGASGRFVLLELNARFWGSLPLSIVAGIDFPHYFFQLVCEGRTSFPTRYRHNVYCRNMLNDVRWTWRSLWSNGGGNDAFTNGWAINHASRWRTLQELTRAITFRDYSDTFALDDLWPAGAELIQLCQLALPLTRRTTGINRT